VIRFGPFELDPHTSELRRNGEGIPLAPQPFRLLLALATRPGELMTREELRQKVWDEGTFVDFERGLNFCILQVRTALGDDAKNPQYVETLPKRGYRFVGTIEAEAGGLKPAAPHRWRMAAAAAGLIVVIFAIAWQRVAEPVSGRPMIAVLPFDDLSASRSAYLADGMTEELITHLGRIHPQRLGVIARTSVLRYAGTKKNVRTIGRELGARYIVEGSVRREGDHVRVTAQLIDAKDQTHLWADSFDRSGSGALGIQEDVAARIARALRIEILDETALTARNDAAHDAYLRGRYLWQQNKPDEAARELREAVRIEPGFALAHIALAEAVHAMAMREHVSPADAAKEIRRCSEAALRLAPSLAQSHAITAMLRFWYEWDFDAADESFRRAIELNPSEPGALHDHGWLLIVRGAKDQGIQEIRRAQELDPVSPRANAHVAWAYIYTGRYNDAIREAQRALELSPEFHEAYRCIEHANALIKGQQIVQPQQPRNAYETAAAMAAAQHNDQALAWLRRAKAERNMEFPLAAVDPKLASLRGNAEFEALLIRPRTR
jgi:TolB-like protein/DNA-binding winged helix-turn-helix (wHTH) protein/Tfp pilus assembly protein PilF